jgi:hypothetical protein
MGRQKVGVDFFSVAVLMAATLFGGAKMYSVFNRAHA